MVFNSILGGLQARMALPSMLGIQPKSLCLLLNVDIEC